MKYAVAASLAAPLFATSIEALQLGKRDSPKVLSVPFERRHTPRHTVSSRTLKRQSKTISQTLDNFEQGSLYFANVTVGTPPQNIRFHLDTGSSDLWSNSADSRLCSADEIAEAQGSRTCATGGTYNANDSSTYEYVSSDFFISYADNTHAKGDYVKDTLRIGNSELKAQQFAVGYDSTSSEGVMGIGFPNLEVKVVLDNEQPYDNIPMTMVKQGLINTAAYSLWLDDLFSSTGNVLFGGVDQDKYIGNLHTLPIIKDGGQFVEMLVQLDNVYMTSGSNNDSMLNDPITVLLDSGSTLSYLPTQAAAQIYRAVGATYNNQFGGALCNCDLANSSTTFDFSFGGKIIEVRMEELVLPSGVQGAGSDFECMFGILPQSDTDTSGGSNQQVTYTLGDTFIRNAYIVYDLSQGEISLAQTNFNSDKSQVIEITSSNDGTTQTGLGDASDSQRQESSGSGNGGDGSAGVVVRPVMALLGLGLLVALVL